ncbi:nitrite reductase small subunit NirD [Aeromicrobium ponti]|uniref:Nitrite reductase (NADH) small subunit n=1 Tax=Cytobacillus oceanisediminis TaxID=665099 RepID=A0A562JRQ9_9BACI|nr:nitrite reductase small subunit NirD [Cytobacillus oceanisediminis]TWH85831.1 nitrite reductase (NADH) small subunit [Cytobacillus oceanisediminis]
MLNKSVVKVLIGSMHELPEKLGKTVKVNGTDIAVFRLSNGKIRAIENRCPHKGGVLTEGLVSGDSVFCPMHDWKICLEDGKVQAPDTGCVQTYKTVVENGTVYLIIEE